MVDFAPIFRMLLSFRRLRRGRTFSEGTAACFASSKLSRSCTTASSSTLYAVGWMGAKSALPFDLLTFALLLKRSQRRSMSREVVCILAGVIVPWRINSSGAWRRLRRTGLVPPPVHEPSKQAMRRSFHQANQSIHELMYIPFNSTVVS